MPKAITGSITCHYTVHRHKGPILVLVHGAGGGRLNWPGALRRMPGATVYSLDLPGHGKSTGDGRDSIRDYADDLLRFMDALGIGQAVLVGHSMGGAISQTVALVAPDRVAGLVLIGTGARLQVAPTILEGLESDFQQAIEWITEWAWAPGADPELVSAGRQAMLEVDAQTVLGDFVACNRFDLRDQVGRIVAPTLVVTGTQDRLTPPRFGQWLAENIPQASFVLIEAAGHMVMLENPVETAVAVRAFLALDP